MKQGTLRKYTLKQDFFDQIDSEEKAYWLGFVMADGCVCGNKLTIRIKKSDQNHIEKFLKSIGGNHPIKNVWCEKRSKLFEASYVNIYSKYMVCSLARHGVVPRKSCKEVVFKGTPELVRHFYRGVFDGDGSISVFSTYSSPNDQWRVNLCGSLEIVSGFAEFIKQQVFHTAPAIGKTGKLHHITYGGIGKPRDIVYHIYSDACVFLERKKNLADQLMAIKVRSTKSFSKNQLIDLYNSIGSWSEVAQHLNMDLKTFYRRRKVLGLIDGR